MTGIPSQAKRQAILEAATEAFLRSGYAASVDEIAAIAGVGKQTVYRHFGDKQALFLAAVSAARLPSDAIGRPDWSFRATARSRAEVDRGDQAAFPEAGHADQAALLKDRHGDQAAHHGDQAAHPQGRHSDQAAPLKNRHGDQAAHHGDQAAHSQGRHGDLAAPLKDRHSDQAAPLKDGHGDQPPLPEGRRGDEPVLPDTGDPPADLTAIGERILASALSPTVAALHRLTIAEIANHPELSEHWGDGTAPFLDVLTGYFRHCHEAGLLDAPDPALAARQFALLLVTEGRVASAYGTRPLTAEQTHRLAAETADLIVRAHRPSRDN